MPLKESDRDIINSLKESAVNISPQTKLLPLVLKLLRRLSPAIQVGLALLSITEDRLDFVLPEHWKTILCIECNEESLRVT
jgi:hypothetical protein